MYNNIIPICDPLAGYLAHRFSIDQAIQKVLESGRYILGTEVQVFEKEFAAFLGAGFAVGVATGTDAIELALRALDIGSQSVVFSVSHTAVATIAGIERTGATVVYVDVDPKTYTMDPESLLKAIRSLPDTGLIPHAIVPVHLYGHPADMESICAIAKEYGLKIVEDCAQAHGASIGQQQVGLWGDAAAFSFYPTKNLGALGDGGCVVTNDHSAYEKMISLRQYGWQERYVSAIRGINSRLDELQAAILRVQLSELNKDNEVRRTIAGTYNEAAAGNGLVCPETCLNSVHVYHLYVIQSNMRNKLSGFLREKGISSAIHYPLPVHHQPAYKNGAMLPKGGLPVTDNIVSKILTLPLYPQMSQENISRVCQTLSEWRE